MAGDSVPAVGFVLQHGERGVGEVLEDVHRFPLQQQRLLHKLLLRLHQQLHRLRQDLQRLGHGGQEHPGGLLLLDALRRQLGDVVLNPGSGASWQVGVRRRETLWGLDVGV